MIVSASRVLQVLAMFSASALVCGCSGPAQLGLDTAQVSAGGTGIGIGFGSAEMIYRGEVANGSLCMWVETSTGEQVSLRWPKGYVAKQDPLRVEDSSGRTVARVGDHLTGREGGSPLAETGCHQGAASTFLLTTGGN